MPQTVRLTEELMEAFPGKVQKLILVPSRGGVFDVVVDGALVFSKHKVGRHANSGEVVALIQSQ